MLVLDNARVALLQAMSMLVTVLCPGGRRQVVMVTPNTSILQVLEEACNKQKLDPKSFDLM